MAIQSAQVSNNKSSSPTSPPVPQCLFFRGERSFKHWDAHSRTWASGIMPKENHNRKRQARRHVYELRSVPFFLGSFLGARTTWPGPLGRPRLRCVGKREMETTRLDNMLAASPSSKNGAGTTTAGRFNADKNNLVKDLFEVQR